jgi:hypothetical protein
MQRNSFGDLRNFFHTGKQERESDQNEAEEREDETGSDGTGKDIGDDSPFPNQSSDEEEFESIFNAVTESPEQPIPSSHVINPRPPPPPNPKTTDECLKRIEDILRPKRTNGKGHRDLHLNLVLRARLEVMANFLQIYQMKGYEGWIKASELAAAIAGRKKTMAWRLREWTRALI